MMASGLQWRTRAALVGIALPSALVAVLGARMIVQDRELARHRVRETRARFAEDISRSLLAQAEGISSVESHPRPSAAFVEEPTALVAKVGASGLIGPIPPTRDTADERRARLLAAHPEIISAARGAFGEARLVAFDSARWLVTVRAAARGEFLVAMRTSALLRAAGVTTVLGDSVRIAAAAAAPVEDAVLLGNGIRGLALQWRDPSPAAVSGATAYYVATVTLTVALAALSAFFFGRDVRRELRLADLRQQFVTGISHELRTPLTAIRMFAETLRDRPLPETTRAEYLSIVVGEIQRLTRLVENVLDFSRIERGAQRYTLDVADLGEAVQESLRALDYSLRQDGFRLRLRCDDDLPRVRLDRDAIGQVVVNLVSNAMKYSGASRDIEVDVRRNGQEAVLTVRDYGIGLPPHERSRLFHPYYRSPSVESHVTGTGIGLTLASHVAAAHGGRITVESDVGRGSAFTLHLPLLNET
jgi:signal transduction histidine kinase